MEGGMYMFVVLFFPLPSPTNTYISILLPTFKYINLILISVLRTGGATHPSPTAGEARQGGAVRGLAGIVLVLARLWGIDYIVRLGYTAIGYSLIVGHGTIHSILKACYCSDRENSYLMGVRYGFETSLIISLKTNGFSSGFST